MKHSFKKLISLVLVLAISLAIYIPTSAEIKDSETNGAGSSSVCSNSSANKIGPSGDSMTDKPITIEEQEQALIKDSSISSEKKSKFLKKFEAYKELKRKTNNMASIQSTNDPSSGYISVPYFKQEKNYWCGPATTKQTLQYISGSSSSQAVIAKAIGTTTDGSNLSDMVSYLNNNQSNKNYVIVTDPSEDLIQGIAKVIVDDQAPAIGRLAFKKGGNWEYSTRGHYLNITGYSNGGSSIRVTDPYIGWISPSSSGSYYVTSNEVYIATKDHFARQISY